jgi:hypothetical protein|tara:strand:+ start:205 stop:402 length:198 start_codon:yes stop_codon:yes gene_type:complete
MTQVGQIRNAIQNAYTVLDTMPEPKPQSTGLLTRTEQKQPEKKMNDAVRLLKLARDKTNGRYKAG